MRLAYGLFALSMAGLCGAVAVPQGQDAKAEDVFKNITSFKGDKASDVIPAMEFMSASLKVDCNFCHTEDRASDSVRAKGAARAMIAMQRDINKNHFGGRNQVTCATCHAGHVHPVAVPPVAGLEVRAQRSQTVKPEEVLASYEKAVGSDGTKPAGGFVMSGTLTKEGAKSQLTMKRLNGKFIMESKNNKGGDRQGFNGTMAWFTTPKGIQPVPLAYAERYVNMNLIFTGPKSLPDLTNTSGGTATVAGKELVVVSGTTSDKTRVQLFFEKKTGLLTRSTFSYPSILGNTVQINDYMNYRKVDGVQVPMTVVNHSAEGDSIQEFKSVKSDSSLTATSFDPPKG